MNRWAVHGAVGLASVCAALTMLSVPVLGQAVDRPGAPAFTRLALDGRVPIVRQEHYVMNARVRPLVLFWVGRDDVGGARITWRRGADGRRAFELLVGSDPVRAPRKINRWGFIVEEVRGEISEVLGVMKETGERTLEEARTHTERGAGERTTFKAVRTTVTGNRAVTKTLAFAAPADLTYRELEALLSLIPAQPQTVRTVDLPATAARGFLLAMASLIHDTAAPCRDRDGAKARTVEYFYNQVLYDLSVSSCRYAAELRTKVGVFGEVVTGQFQLRNKKTRDITRFQVDYGLSAAHHEVPIRVVFRPHWWIEIELLLDRDWKHRP
jgi:hypothetical protein